MTAPEYRHLVEADFLGRHVRLYDGTDAADAMAAWSRAVSEGTAYVTIESLVRPRALEHPVPSEHRDRVCVVCEEPEGQPHKPWCPVMTGTLSSLPGAGDPP